MKTPAAFTGPEPLEARIAPATLVSPTTATFTDQDGDLATVKFSKPILDAGNLGTILGFTLVGSGERLDTINLTGIAAAVGTGISVTAKVAGNGNGLVNVGRIISDADLGAVTIKGDLTEIDAGDMADTTTAGLKSLTVQSFGLAAFIAGTASVDSTIRGALGKLSVKTDFIGEHLDVVGTANVDGKIGSVTIGGNLAGTGGVGSGFIYARGAVGTVKIGGSIVGGTAMGAGQFSAASFTSITLGGSLRAGTAASTGLISADGIIGKIKIARDIIGGTLTETGHIFGGAGIGTLTVGGSVRGGVIVSDAGSISSVKIGADLLGGSADMKGFIFAKDGIGSVAIGGSLLGGTGGQSGAITSNGDIGTVKIGGDFRGGGTTGATLDSGQISTPAGSIGNVTIGGDAVAAFGDGTGSILARGNIGAVKVGGSIYSAGSANFTIRAQGLAAKPLAIAALTVVGGVSDAVILGGYGTSNTAVSGFAGIGPVKVGGNWLASSIASGVAVTVVPFPNFGTVNDALVVVPNLISKIASISIGGAVSGTSGGTDHYGFVAAQIGKLTIGGSKIALKAPGAGPIDLGFSGDFTAVQLA